MTPRVAGRRQEGSVCLQGELQLKNRKKRSHNWATLVWVKHRQCKQQKQPIRGGVGRVLHESQPAIHSNTSVIRS